MPTRHKNVAIQSGFRSVVHLISEHVCGGIRLFWQEEQPGSLSFGIVHVFSDRVLLPDIAAGYHNGALEVQFLTVMKLGQMSYLHPF